MSKEKSVYFTIGQTKILHNETGKILQFIKACIVTTSNTVTLQIQGIILDEIQG